MSFEVDRFVWSPGALEVSGVIRAPTPRQFRHVELVVQHGEQTERLAPAMAAPMRATPEGVRWTGTFRWDADRPPEHAVLEAGRGNLVRLPAPEHLHVLPGAPPVRADPSDPAYVAHLEAELAAVRSELAVERQLIAELRERLAIERRRREAAETAAHEDEEEIQREALAAAWHVAQELAAERREIAAAREALAAERAQLEAQRALVPPDAAPLPAAGVAAAAVGAPATGPAPPAAPPAASSNGAVAGLGPRHAAIVRALQRPRQPDDRVRGRAPLLVRAVAVTLLLGVLLMLGIVVDAVV